MATASSSSSRPILLPRQDDDDDGGGGGSVRLLVRRRRSSAAVEQPFYGRPRPPPRSSSTTIAGRIAIAVVNAGTALSDPTRADAVAALGEVTGTLTLSRIRDRMVEDPIGREILRDRPIVAGKSTPEIEKLIENAPSLEEIDPSTHTFGQAYGSFLKEHGFDPDDRDDVRHVEDESLSYVMLRYRQNHDFFHALTGLPPTVLGELGLKWLELFETGLPIAALSCTVGSLALEDDDESERSILRDVYLPWAVRQHRRRTLANAPSLMNVYYEKEFDTILGDLRDRLHLEPAPSSSSSNAP